MKKVIFAIMLAFSFGAAMAADAPQEKQKLCVGKSDAIKEKCKTGDVVILKSKFGFILPMQVCDYSKQIIYTDGKPESCVYIGYFRDGDYL